MKIAGLFRKLFLFMALLAGLPAIAQEETLTESNNIRIDPEWMKAFGAGSDISSVYDVKTDRNGNIYQTGYFSRYLHLEQQTIAPKCQTGDCSNYFFLSKHDNRGQLLWVRYALGNSRPAAMAFDSKGNIFVAGTVWSRGLRFTSEDTLTVKLDKPNNYDNGIFICKYSPEGKVLQTSFHRDTHPQEASGLYLDKQANLYVAGSFHYRSYDRRDEVKRSFLLLKFNKKGKLLWQQKGDTVSTSDASAVHVHKGQAYVTGGYWKEMKLGQHSFTWNYSTNRAFVASFNAKGKLLWATDSIGKPYGAYGKDLASDAKGNLYVYGKTVTDDLFLARLDKAGKPVWAQTTKGRTQYPQQMLLDKNNNIYLCGQGYSAEFSSSGPDRYGYKTGANLDLFLASYSDKGELRWLKAGGGEGTNYCRAIALNKNSLIALGAHNAKLQFNDTILTPRNAHSFWLASFDLKKLEFMDPSPQ
ncbi:MAG TPA: hypothetical protein VK927_03045, partial [Adhaeribacter sp.]|nr:hypothetical protein [Adhaeribacter sp.]